MTVTAEQRSELAEPLLSLNDVHVKYPLGRGRTAHAVNGVSLDIRPGETLGLVGESGCGKSTLGKAIVQLVQIASGSIVFAGDELTRLSGPELRQARCKLQMIFQDPISSLNPRRQIADIVREPLAIWGRGTPEDQTARIRELLDQVGIAVDTVGQRRPHELSGGQCQRVSIARALALSPTMLVCDEPVSALDMSVQAQVLNLLEDLKAAFGLTLLFISHDLAVVKNISDRVAVMYLGRIVELTESTELYERPAHPYTRGLLAAVPSADDAQAGSSDGAILEGELPSPINPPSGCHFRTRCPYAQRRCADDAPELRPVAPGHHVACHFPLYRQDPDRVA